MDIDKVNRHSDIPVEYYEIIAPYLNTPPTRHTLESLVSLYSNALHYIQENPAQRSAISEWTVSATANSELIHDNPDIETIQQLFGSLEVDSDNDSREAMIEIEQMLDSVKEYV